MEYYLEKNIWTDADFEQMGWHDCYIYKIRLGKDLEFDIDYIFQWNQPDVEGLPFTFWIAPATLVFKSVQHLNFDIDVVYENAFQIEGIERNFNGHEYCWTIITRRGEIQLQCNGYEQFIRQKPSFEFSQRISYLDRYGDSLERTTEQFNPNRNRPELAEKRLKDLEDYELVKKRRIKKLELDKLVLEKDNEQIALKYYLVKRKELNDEIFSHTYFLKDTRFENW